MATPWATASSGSSQVPFHLSAEYVAAALTHVPHVEDYPVMTTESARFQIVPDGFFDSDRALDAPSQ